METESRRPFYFKFSMILLMLLLICIFLYYAQNIVVPLALAFLLAILLLPMNSFLQKHRFSRVGAIFFSIIISFIFIGGIIYFLSTQLLAFLDDIPQIKSRIDELVYSIQKWLHHRFGITLREQASYLNNAKDSGGTIINDTFLSLKDTLFVLTLLPIFTFLILYYRDMLKRFLILLFKSEDRPKVQEVILESRIVVQSYMAGLLIEMGIVAVINFIGFALIGIKYAVFLAVFAAILNLIPYVGMLIASIFCSLVTLTSSPHMSDAFWTLAVLWIVQFFDNNIIMPKVVGSKVKINALITIIGVLTGAALCGIPGMFLSIPAIAILKVIFERVDELKPWGMLLSDDITHNRPMKIYSRRKKVQKEEVVDKSVS